MEKRKYRRATVGGSLGYTTPRGLQLVVLSGKRISCQREQVPGGCSKERIITVYTLGTFRYIWEEATDRGALVASREGGASISSGLVGFVRGVRGRQE